MRVSGNQPLRHSGGILARRDVIPAIVPVAEVAAVFTAMQRYANADHYVLTDLQAIYIEAGSYPGMKDVQFAPDHVQHLVDLGWVVAFPIIKGKAWNGKIYKLMHTEFDTEACAAYMEGLSPHREEIAAIDAEIEKLRRAEGKIQNKIAELEAKRLKLTQPDTSANAAV